MFGPGGEDPFKDIENFFRRMSQTGSGLPHFGSGMTASSYSRNLGSGGTFESIARGSFAPGVTIADSGNQFIVDVDVPGVAREDLKVTATSQKLCLSGQRRPAEMQQQGATILVDERPTGFFERCFTFPHKIDENAVTAQYANGVLSVSVAHSGPKDPSKEININ